MFESWPELWGGGYPAYRTTLRKFLWFRTVTGGNAPQYDTVIGKIVQFVTRRAAPLKIEATLTPIQSGTGDPSPDNIRPISGHTGAEVYVEDEYDAQATPSVTVTFGTTVYGGTLTVNEDGTGSVVADRALNLINAESTLNINGTTAGVSTEVRYIPSPTKANGEFNFISSVFNVASGTEVGKARGRTTSGNVFFRVPDSVTTVAEAQAWFGNNPTQICYDLAEPVTIPLTPGQVNALQGNNTVWVDDSGEIKVTYRSN